MDSESFIQVGTVTKDYVTGTGTIRALESLDLEVRKGEFVSVVGPSGCGKSTLLMIIAGLIPPSAGDVKIDGVAVKKPYTDLGIVFQRDLLFDWRSVLENVLIQSEIRRLKRADYEERARDLLRRVGLGDFTEHFPGELSGGMRQRVSICRALVHDPPLLLMDEPFGALDALTRDQMNLDLLRIWEEKRKTVLFVTHSIAEAVFLSDRVLVMSRRPGRFIGNISIDLGRPRHLSTRDRPEFTAYTRQIRDIFQEQGVLVEEDQADDPKPL